MIVPQREEICIYCGEVIKKYDHLHHADVEDGGGYCHDACCPICKERYAEIDYIEE